MKTKTELVKLSPVLMGGVDNGSIYFQCPGCKTHHHIKVGSGEGVHWEYNGNPDAPTFKPSVLVTYNGEDAGKGSAPQAKCHSFITDGQIQFLDDSTHELKGQTVPLPEWSDKQ